MALSTLDTLARDVRFSIRGLRKSPGFTAVAVLSLALGLGATTALFSLVDALLLRPLPVAEPERLVFIQRTASASGKPMPLDRVALDTLGTARDLLAGVAAVVPVNRASVVIDGIAEPDRLVMQATANLFEVLGVRAAVGRLDLPADGAPVAVISSRFWRARFSTRARTVAGAHVIVNGQSYAIAGVTPATFLGLSTGRVGRRVARVPHSHRRGDVGRRTAAARRDDGAGDRRRDRRARRARPDAESDGRRRPDRHRDLVRGAWFLEFARPVS